jgi:hypothetical protein
MTRICAALLALLAVALLITACGGDDDDDDPANDERTARVGSVSELATYAWIDAAAAGLYDYLSSDVTTACTVDQVAEALAEHEQPTGWQQVKDVEFQGDTEATATVILIYGSDREEEEWGFTQESGDSWRVSHVPGLEDCEAAE